jgi:hypothetical protein
MRRRFVMMAALAALLGAVSLEAGQAAEESTSAMDRGPRPGYGGGGTPPPRGGPPPAPRSGPSTPPRSGSPPPPRAGGGYYSPPPPPRPYYDPPPRPYYGGPYGGPRPYYGGPPLGYQCLVRNPFGRRVCDLYRPRPIDSRCDCGGPFRGRVIP